MPDRQTYLTTDLAPRLAAIDIGSNSVRLVVAEAQPKGRYRILDEERETTRLGRSLGSSGKIDPESLEESLAALRRFLSISAGLGVESPRAIATCAVREAENGAQFCQRVAEELQLPIEVLSSQKEAHLAFLSVRRRIDLSDKNTLLADIGGGSTEIILASGELIKAIYATKLGAVRLSEQFGGDQSLSGEDFKRMTKRIDRELKKSTDKPAVPLHMLIGSGGTFTNLASMVMTARGQSRLPVAGCRVSRAELRHLLDRLRKMSPKQRREMPGLNPDRADIIVPGLATIDRMMRRFKVNLLQVHAYGVRDGLLLSMFEQLQGHSEADTPDPIAQIERFATACGVELDHARHAALLSQQIYAGLKELYELDEPDLRLLDAASLLQDVGYLINYKGHHKHSYHLILHSRLEGFRPEELEIVANVARYHRGPPPRNKHKGFRRLCSEDQARVLTLAAILRLASALDRTQNQSITSVRVKGSKKQIELLVSAPEHPEADLWAARRRAELFEKVFDAELTVQWDGGESRV